MDLKIPCNVKRFILMTLGGYKMLALFVYHPAIQFILRLATMEVKNESTHEISLFWKLFNEIPSQITELDYTFNPEDIMVDKNGVNYCTIRQVFGLNFMTSKMVSCQMHYKNDINKASFRIEVYFRDIFKCACYEMSSVGTVAQYTE